MMIVGSEVANLSSIPVRPNYRWRRTIPPDYMKPNLRRCLSCRQVAHKDKFWRVVRVYPKRTIQLDKGMGRSAYLCPQESCLRAARKKIGWGEF